MKNEIIPPELIENKIYIIRNYRVMLDSDLALLYDVETKVLNQAVKRNTDRFPEDFMFQLSDEEWEFLRSQIVTSKKSRGGKRYTPYVFTEHGVLMLSNILNSKKAIAVSIQIIRVFAKLREMALTHKDLTYQLREFEQRFIGYAKDTNIELNEHTQKIAEIFKQLDYLKDISRPSQIGFKTDN